MSGTERAASGRARSTHVVHIQAPGWPATAERITPLVSRIDPATPATQVLVLVPAAVDVVELGRALRACNGGNVAVGAWSTPRRALRLARDTHPPVVVTTPAVAASLLAASALNLAGVTGVAFAAAAELEHDAAHLEVVLAEVPAEAAKVLDTATATPFVESLIASHMHGARRLGPAVPAPAPATSITVEVLNASPAAPAALLGDVLETVDAPSAFIVAADERRAQAGREALDALGYPPDSPLARVSDGTGVSGAALVVFLGAPSTAVLASVLATPPARAVALVSTREKVALAAAGHVLAPFSPLPSRGAAVTAEELMRDRLRRSIAQAQPAREMLALEPLLAEFDALELAGAALRLYEAERATAARVVAAPTPRANPGAAGDRDARGQRRDGERGAPPKFGGRGGPPRGRGRPPTFGSRGAGPRGRNGPPKKSP